MTENRIYWQIKEYLDYKHSLGFKLKNEESVLRNFAKYTMDNEYDGPVCMDIVLQWVASGCHSDKTMGRKIEVIRPFSRYAHSFDCEAEVIHKLIYKNVHDRPCPYIYSEAEIVKLMNECRSLYSPDGIRAYTIETIIGLLWATGLRPSEPTNLSVEDVDLIQGILHIKKTKFSKDRFIPIDSSVAYKLQKYSGWIERELGHKPPKEAFFYTTGGKPLKESALSYAFSLIRPSISAKPIGYPHVRLYDFRHTMACNTILRWIKQGTDINSKLHILSTYLGHVRPQDTYWYLSATPELLELSCTKYEAEFGGDTDVI